MGRGLAAILMSRYWDVIMHHILDLAVGMCENGVVIFLELVIWTRS